MAASLGNSNFSNTSETDWSIVLNNNGTTVCVAIMMDSGNTISGIPTVDGANMTLGRSQADSSRKVWIYYIDDVASGNVTCAGNLNGISNRYVRCQSVKGTAFATGSLGNVNGSNGSSSSRAVALNTTLGSFLFNALVCDDSPGAISPDGSTSELWEADIAATSNVAWGGHGAGDGGSVSTGGSWSSSVSNAMAVIEILPSATGTQVMIFASRMWEFYKELKLGLKSHDELEEMYGELMTI